jgi:outer membrane protein insertion porin family
VPTAHEDTKTVDSLSSWTPGSRAYVRRINFINTSAINDEVLRREMRQMEGSYLSNALLERSKERLQRLPYIEKVDYETNPVPGNARPRRRRLRREGRPAGPVQRRHRLLRVAVVHAERQLRALELHGIWRARRARAGAGQYSKTYSLSHTDPYTNIDNVSRTIGLTYRDVTQYVSAASDFSTTTISGTLEYGYPISEYAGLRFGLIAQRSDLIVNPVSSAPEAVDWVQNNGNPYTREIKHESPGTEPGRPADRHDDDALWHEVRHVRARRQHLFRLAQPRDLRDRGLQHSLAPRRHGAGQRGQLLHGALRLPAAPIRSGRNGRSPWPRTSPMATALGKDTTSLPPYRQFFAGGPDTVRGFSESRLGPKDGFGNPYGGNLKVVGRAEVLFPVPEKWRASTRISAFLRHRQRLLAGHGHPVRGPDGRTPVDYQFDYNELKQSVGLAIQWFAPLGVFGSATAYR